MDKLENDLRIFCFQAPRWMLLEIQAFMYGLISWSITCAEDLVIPDPKSISIRDLLIHSDGEFEDWPTEWLEPYMHTYLSLNPTLTEQNEFFSNKWSLNEEVSCDFYFRFLFYTFSISFFIFICTCVIMLIFIQYVIPS
jgi:hypothetical protein